MSRSMIELGIDGRVAIVTGAGSGVGRETAIQLAKMGAKLALFGRRLETVAKVAEEIQALPGAGASDANLSENAILLISDNFMYTS